MNMTVPTTIIEYQQVNPPLEGQVTIVSRGVDPDGRAWVATDRRLAHPRGGGQQEDRGFIGASTLLSVAHDDEHGVKHYVSSIDGLDEGAVVELVIDPRWRFLQSRSHTAGHAIASVVSRLNPQLRPASAHHWLGEARVEFEGNITEGSGFGERLIEGVRELATRDHPVLLSADPAGRRVITIDGLATGCGGTHLTGCGALASVQLRGIKEKGGRVRIGYGFSDETLS